MLLADLLLRLNVAQLISNFLQASMNDSPALPMLLQLAQGVVQQNEATAKRKLYALAISTVCSFHTWLWAWKSARER
eukprot:scaffold244995_cov32-Tisochrysis_lutea.AAC.4